MTITRKYVLTLSDDVKRTIIENNETFETWGVIGDEPIRLHAHKMLEDSGIPDNSIVWWMMQLAYECHRYFSMRYLNAKNKDDVAPLS